MFRLMRLHGNLEGIPEPCSPTWALAVWWHEVFPALFPAWYERMKQRWRDEYWAERRASSQQEPPCTAYSSDH